LSESSPLLAIVVVAAMVKAFFHGVLVAESDRTVQVDGNHYFPPHSIVREHFVGPTELHTVCGWKGVASYYTLRAGGAEAANAAWFYPDTKEGAMHIRGHIAFYKHHVRFEE
jgi:uncharacterized protein (DUF427 family)